jgi:hypothetical protein
MLLFFFFFFLFFSFTQPPNKRQNAQTYRPPLTRSHTRKIARLRFGLSISWSSLKLSNPGIRAVSGVYTYALGPASSDVVDAEAFVRIDADVYVRATCDVVDADGWG